MMDFESMSKSIYAEYKDIDTFLDDVDLFSIYPELESSSKPADFPDNDIDFSEYFDFDKYYGVEESSSKPAENPNTSSEHSSSAAHPNNSDFSPAPTSSNGFATSSISPTESGTTPTISSKPRENNSSSDETLADGVDVRRASWQNVVNGHPADGSGPSPCGPPRRNDSTTHNGPMHGSTAHSGPEIQDGPMPPHVPKMQHGIQMPTHVPKMQDGVLTYNSVPMPRDCSLGSLMNTGPMPTSVSPLSTGLVPWNIFLMQDDTISQDSA
ncbi:hypothetical protein V501_01802 [Pseudogymnoascus sp. VKM F-4519 (FW-2642)]|nr:hypothetical protein V501_01802 [Pseudogymnoascus sp. VKM F-4519 (FW-2642)]